MNKYYTLSIIVTIFATFLQYKVFAKPPLGIVHGTDAEEGEFPYLVQLTHGSSFSCGGGILGPEWILTAGHCVDGIDIHSIVYGTNILYDLDTSINTTILVKNKFLHPKFQYTKNGLIYDVGILQLAEPIVLNRNAQPIKLPDANQDIPYHVQGVLAGWGYNKTKGNVMPYLQKVNLQILTDGECIKNIFAFSHDDSFMSTHDICTDDNYASPCSGDSGSPFVINGTQYGIVSYGFGACGAVPAAYSRITNPEYRNWIKNITNV